MALVGLAACTSHHAAVVQIPTSFPPSRELAQPVESGCGTGAPWPAATATPVTEAELDYLIKRVQKAIPGQYAGSAWVAGPVGGRRHMRVFATEAASARHALGIIPEKYCSRVSLYLVPRSLDDLKAVRIRVVTMLKAQHAVESSMWPNGVTDRLEIEVPVHSYLTCLAAPPDVPSKSPTRWRTTPSG